MIASGLIVGGSFYLKNSQTLKPVTISQTSLSSPKPTVAISQLVDPKLNQAKARNGYRKMVVQNYVKAIKKYAVDHGVIPSMITMAPKNISKKGADLCTLLIEDQYLGGRLETEVDSVTGNSGQVTDCSLNYDTEFAVAKSADGAKITVSAPKAELGEIISYSE